MAKPRYQSIVEELLRRRRRLRAPLRLPDEHTMAQEHGVSRDTIRRALKALAQHEAIVRRPRHGTYLQPVNPVIKGARGQVIGFIPPWWADSLTAWHTASVFEGLSQWADQQGCHISVLHSQAVPDADHVWLQRIRERKLSGLIWLSPQSQQMGLIRRIAHIAPMVVVGRHEMGRDIHHVSPDYEQAAGLIDEHLVSLGHTTYGVVGSDIMGSYSQTWIRALQKTFTRRGQSLDVSRQFLDVRPFSRARLPELLLDFFLPAQPGSPQALVFTSADYLIPTMAMDRFRQRVGRDLSVACIDMGSQPMHSYHPSLAFDHVRCNWPEVGRQAVIRLLQVITKQQVSPQLTLPVQLVKGESCVARQQARHS